MRLPEEIRDGSPIALYLHAVYGPSKANLGGHHKPSDIEFWYTHLLPAKRCSRYSTWKKPVMCPSSTCAQWLPRPLPPEATVLARFNDTRFDLAADFVVLKEPPALRNAIQPDAWVEVYRHFSSQEDDFSHYGCWNTVARGTGVWVNVGRVANIQVSHMASWKNEELARLLGRDEQEMQILWRQTQSITNPEGVNKKADPAWGALLPSANFTSVHLTDRGGTATVGWRHSEELVLFTPGCLAGHGALTSHCRTASEAWPTCACMPGVSLRAGWGAMEPCKCDARSARLSCLAGQHLHAQVNVAASTPSAAPSSTPGPPSVTHGSWQGNRTYFTKEFCANHWCSATCCQTCDQSQRPILFVHIEKTGGSTIECTTQHLADTGFWVNLGHNQAKNVEACEVKCKPREKLIGVRHPLAFYLSAYHEYVTSRKGTMSFAAYLQLVFDPRVGGMPYYTLTQRVKRSCGVRCNEFTIIRTETLSNDLGNVLRRNGLLPVAMNMAHTAAQVGEQGAFSRYTCAQVLKVAELDKWIYQTFNYSDYDKRCKNTSASVDERGAQ